MPITKSAKKALRGSMRKKAINDRRKKVMQDTMKRLLKLAKTSKEEAKKILSSAYAAIDKAAKQGVIKKNTAARKKARLARAVK